MWSLDVTLTKLNFKRALKASLLKLFKLWFRTVCHTLGIEQHNRKKIFRNSNYKVLSAVLVNTSLKNYRSSTYRCSLWTAKCWPVTKQSHNITAGILTKTTSTAPIYNPIALKFKGQMGCKSVTFSLRILSLFCLLW